MYGTGVVDDAALVLAARGGDKEAFAAIYDRYADRLHNFIFTIVRDRHEAADILHDTFLDAGGRLYQLRDPAKLRPWLFATARHNAFRSLRARSRTEPMPEVDVIGTSSDPADDALRTELRQLVDAASEGLSPRDRAVLELHLREGLEGQELGDAMGVTANHAYVLLTRLRGQFERALGALLIAQRASRDCPELAALLEGWDGRFSPLLRKRVARHADHCRVCSETRRRVLTPAELLSAIPLIPAQAQIRDRVLDDVRLVSHRVRRLPERRRGFPPREGDPIRRARTAVLSATAIAMLVISTTIWLGGDLEGSAEGVSAEERKEAVVDEPPAPSTAEPRLTRASTVERTASPEVEPRVQRERTEGSEEEDEVAEPEPTPTPRPTFEPRSTTAPKETTAPTASPRRRSIRP